MTISFITETASRKYGHLPTKSAIIRQMNKDGYSRTAISKELSILYQHVRNVLTNEPKRPIVEVQQVISWDNASYTE